MKTFRLGALPAWVHCDGLGFGDKFMLRLSPDAEAAGANGRLALRIVRHGPSAVVHNTEIAIESIQGNLLVAVGGDDSSVAFGRGASGTFSLHLWRAATVRIGPRTTGNGVRIVGDLSDFECGEDCMFSDTVLVQGGDQHGIVDVETGALVNDRRRRTSIGNHVWLGRACTVMPGVDIGEGSIIGTGAIVTADVPPMSIAAGVPARIVASGRTWSRSPEVVDPGVEAMIRAWKSKA